MLRLRSEDDWARFRCALNGFGKTVSEIEAENDVLLEAAETKDKRQEKLNFFFRQAYSRAFNKPQLNDTETPYDKSDSDEVLGVSWLSATGLGASTRDDWNAGKFRCD